MCELCEEFHLTIISLVLKNIPTSKCFMVFINYIFIVMAFQIFQMSKKKHIYVFLDFVTFCVPQRDKIDIL